MRMLTTHPHLVQICDMVDNLSVVWNYRVKFFEGLKGIARETQMHIYQP